MVDCITCDELIEDVDKIMNEKVIVPELHITICFDFQTYNKNYEDYWEEYFKALFGICKYIKVIEEILFKNKLVRVHGTPLNNFKQILADKNIHLGTNIRRDRKDNGKIFFDSMVQTQSIILPLKRTFNYGKNGVAILIVDLSKYNVYERFISCDKFTDYFDNDEIGSPDFNIIKTEYFVKENVDLSDINRIYIISNDLQIVNIIQNKGSDNFIKSTISKSDIEEIAKTIL